MRIAIGQVSQESNTFNPWPTTRKDFESWGVYRGDELEARLGATSEIGGFCQQLVSWPEHPEIVGLVRAFAWPGGPLTGDELTWLTQELDESLDRAMPVDGVLISLHGALVAQDCPDVEGHLLDQVRQRVGPKVPIVATLDLHASVTPRMVQAADALVLFHTAPHIDVYETGVRGAKVLRRILVDHARPVTAYLRLPMVPPAERANTQDPASVSYAIRERLQGLESRQGVLAAGLATVQPWLDVPGLGSAAVIVADGDEKLAEQEARALGAFVLSRRTEYLPELTETSDAVREAHANRDGLYVLSDSANATTSGAPGDSTFVLAEILKHTWDRPALVTMVAPEAVAWAGTAKVGSPVQMPLGGALDHRFSRPLEFVGRVTRLFDARFTLTGHLAKNLPVDMGRAAVFSAGGVHVVLTSRSGPHFAPQLFEAAGFDPYAAAVVVARSPCGFRAAYAARAKKIMVVRAPGCAPADFWNYPYQHRSRPCWPWEDVAAPLEEVLVSRRKVQWLA